jgi:hypothetical protein
VHPATVSKREPARTKFVGCRVHIASRSVCPLYRRGGATGSASA